MIFLWLNIILILSSILAIIFVDKFPKNIVVYDKPDNFRKIHSIPTPLFGGLVFYVNICINTIFFYNELNFGLRLIILLLLLYSFFFSIGYIDDKFSISPGKKTIYILLILLLIIPLHDKIIVNELIFKDLELVVNLNQANIFFTIFSIYFFFNLINFSDGANGITTSLCIYWLIVFAIFGSLYPFFIYSLIIILFLILIFNLKNKIFLGNSGSSLLSIVFASLFIINYNIDKSIKCDEILLMMFIPAIDSLRVTIERIIKGNSPLKPDMRHLHHLLIKQFNKNTVFIPYIILSSLPFLLSIFFNTFIILILSLIFYFIIFYFFNTK